MAFAQKPNTGSLFINKDRKTDTHPNARGSALIGGVEYWIDAWTNHAEGTGEKYQSLKFKVKEAKHETSAAPPIAEAGADDDVPF